MAALLWLAVGTGVLGGCASLVLGDGEADLLLEDLASSFPSRLERHSPPVTRRTVQARVDGRALSGDVYVSGTPRAGIVLVPGLAPAGHRDARLVQFAESLARSRYIVLAPDIADFRQLRVRSQSVRAIADALRVLRDRGELTGHAPVGLGAFSFAVGPTLLAALYPEPGTPPDFVVGVGGYHDLRRLITYATTGQPAPGGAPSARPDERAKWVIALGIADLLPERRDRDAVRARALRGLHGDAANASVDAIAGLGPGGDALVALLTNRDAGRVPALIEALPVELRDELDALDPARHDLSHLGAEVLLLHGAGDAIIPYTESVALASALPRGRARLIVLDGIDHVDLRAGAGNLDQLREAAQAVLDLRRSPVHPR